METPLWLSLWLIAVLKGGARKTTTATFLAFALAALGEDGLLVDADHGTQGVADWMTSIHLAGLPIPFHVVQWSPRAGLLVPFVQQQVRETGAKRVIVDVGGEAPEVLRQIVKAATRVISPAGPEQGELARLPATKAIVAPTKVPMSVLLTRVPVRGGGAARDARRDLTAEGYTVLETEIEQNREKYAHVWGTVPADLGSYGDLASELMKGEA